jgi:LysM repeat protein
MKKVLSSFIFIAFCTVQVAAQQTDYNAVVNRYIQKYKGIAVQEMKEYRVPASITLAQGILESNAGRSNLAVDANNHFGIKCHKGWTGKTFIKDDETKNECFRKYDSPLESFRDHSWFLTQRDRYKGLFNLEMTDYKGWANGLKSAGYATNPLYPQQLIKIIETFELYRFDRAEFAAVTGGSPENIEDASQQAWLQEFLVISMGAGNRNIYENNRLQMIIARQDDNLYVIARDFNLSVSNLLKYNDLPKPTSLKPGQIVYLQPKRRKGTVENHKVKTGETLYSISQFYGVKLKMLYKRNDLRMGLEPKKGTILRLR